MSTNTAYDSIKARLVDQLGSTYAIRDWEEIETQLQQATDPWIALEDSGGNEELTSVGTPQQNWVDDTGYVDVHVFTPSTGSLSVTRTVADAVRASLRYYHFTGLPAGETLRVRSVTTPTIGVLHGGLWHSMYVSVEFINRYAVATAAE